MRDEKNRVCALVTDDHALKLDGTSKVPVLPHEQLLQDRTRQSSPMSRKPQKQHTVGGWPLGTGRAGAGRGREGRREREAAGRVCTVPDRR